MTLRALAVQVDERLADLYDAAWSHENGLQIAAESARRASGQEREVLGKSRWGMTEYGNWIGTLDEALATIDAMPDNGSLYSAERRAKGYAAEVRAHRAALAQIKVEAAELDAVWREEGRWTRAFLVLNANGHVHNGMACSTCYPSTRYEWLTAYSAADETEIVEAAGEMACTVCYPSAPAEVLNRPANLVSKSRAEKQAAADERARLKAEREAKRIAKAATADGSDLRIPASWGDREERIRTEATARQEWNRSQDAIAYAKRDLKDPMVDPRRAEERIDLHSTRQTLIEESLAEKHGITPAEIREQLIRRAAKRRNR